MKFSYGLRPVKFSTRILKLSVALLLSGFAFTGYTGAVEPFHAPALTGPIVDEVGLLTHEHAATLESELRALSQSGKAQVVVLITKSLQELSIEEFGIKLAEAWKIGSKEKANQDRGVIFIVAPEQRRMRIEVGYGLEGEIPDITSSRILEEVVKPNFQRNRMSEGVFEGTRTIIRLAGGVAPGGEEGQAARPRTMALPGRTGPNWIAFGLICLFLFASGIFRRFIGAMGAGGILGAMFLPSMIFGLGAGLILFLLSRLMPQPKRGLFGSSSPGIFGGFGGGGFGGGGFGGGGGGFGGGGGSFGGGGSSSSW